MKGRSRLLRSRKVVWRVCWTGSVVGSLSVWVLRNVDVNVGALRLIASRILLEVPRDSGERLGDNAWRWVCVHWQLVDVK